MLLLLGIVLSFVLVVDWLRGFGALDLVLEGVAAAQACVLAAVLVFAGLLVLLVSLGALHLRALDDRAGEGIDLCHGRTESTARGAHTREFSSCAPRHPLGSSAHWRRRVTRTVRPIARADLKQNLEKPK